MWRLGISIPCWRARTNCHWIGFYTETMDNLYRKLWFFNDFYQMLPSKMMILPYFSIYFPYFSMVNWHVLPQGNQFQWQKYGFSMVFSIFFATETAPNATEDWRICDPLLAVVAQEAWHHGGNPRWRFFTPTWMCGTPWRWYINANTIYSSTIRIRHGLWQNK